MIYASLGRTDTIGASCHFLLIDGTGIVLDAGVDPEESGPASLPDFELVHDRSGWYVDHAIITHAHHDHLGGLPVLIREFPHVIVHMTPETRELADVLLPASARLQRRRQREGRTTHEPLYEEDELELYDHLYLTHRLEEPFDVTGLKGTGVVEAEFFAAGHILGSAGVLLSFKEEGEQRRIFYTSDTNMRPQTILPGGEYPEGPVDVLLLETTHGADPEPEQTTRPEEEERFLEAMQRILGRGGVALVPVFAIGRAQEVLAVIDRFKREGAIDPDTPVYTAGIQRAIAEVYDKTRRNSPRLDPEFKVFGVDQYRVPRSRNAKQRALEEPGIFVVTSGMMFENTLSHWIAQRIVEDERHGILQVGFSKADTPGGRLEAAAQGEEEDVVLDELVGPQPLRCTVERFRFSGHSHRRDLLEIVERLAPQTVVLVHGDEEARGWMADNIAFFHPDINIVVPEASQPIEV